MTPTKFLIPHRQVPEFVENLTAWAATSGNDPQLVQAPTQPATTAISSPVLYSVTVDDDFFTEYRAWRQFVLQ